MRVLLGLVTLLAAVFCVRAQSSSFQPSFQVSQYPTGCPPRDFPRVIAGDFNGDHIPDLAIGCFGQSGQFLNPHISQISVLLGKGDGTFQAPVVTSIIDTPLHSSDVGESSRFGFEQSSLVAVDVNGDGKSDLVFSSYGPRITYGNASGPSWTVTVRLSLGNGTFAPANTVATGLAYAVWGAADLNGDGIPDLVLSYQTGTGFAVMLGKGDGTFSSPTLFAVSNGQNAVPIVLDDFNGDGRPDIITTDTVHSLSIWLNQGDGSFRQPAVAASPNELLSRTPWSTLVGDFNGDGKLDLGVPASGPASPVASLYVFLGNGDGTFQTPEPSIPVFFQTLFGLDLNQDGRTDLAQQSDLGGVIFYLAQRDGALQVLTTESLPEPAIVADFNGDGKPDMAGWVGSSSDQVSIMINTTSLAATTGAANGASFVASEPLTAGAVASVFGVGFASTNFYASAIPLPNTLGNVSVTIAGFPAPLLFVSSKQINLQVPWEVVGRTADIVVTVNGNALAPLDASIGPVSPGIFTTQSGTGQAIAINPDGSLAGPVGSMPGSAIHPAKVGEALVILATGLGPVTPKIADGTNSSDALRNTVTTPKVMIGGESADLLFSGLSPQFVGLNQINVTVPQVKAGVVPLQISMGGVTTSNQVTIAVQ